MTTVVISGAGPHVRFKTTEPNVGTVRVITSKSVQVVPLTQSRTELTFNDAA